MRDKTSQLVTGVLLLVASGWAWAELLSPDPVWKQGTLGNGLHWQILATPQRPADRIEVSLLIRTGALSENNQQAGYSHFLPRLALEQHTPLSAEQALSLWQQSIDPQHPQPVAVTSYNFTRFALSLPNNRPDLLKNALNWLAGSVGNMHITPETVNQALEVEDPVASWPLNTRDGWWRFRLKGSGMLGHDPAVMLKQPVDVPALNGFYRKWYTPDVMTLIIVGNVDGRTVSDQIIKTFSDLQGKRETPAPVATLAALPNTAISISSDKVTQDSLSLMWDAPWQPVSETSALLRHWLADVTREAMFQFMQSKLPDNPVTKDSDLQFHCQVLFQREQCAVTMTIPEDKLQGSAGYLARQLVTLRDNGLTDEEFDALIGQKRDELQKLFATYAHINTRALINQRLQALQNQMVDIAPEQYQKLRQQFLDGLTSAQLNQSLQRTLSREFSLVLFQPEGEAEYDVQQLKTQWERITGAPADTTSSLTSPGGE